MLGLGVSAAAAAGTWLLMGGQRQWWHDGAVLDADFAGGLYAYEDDAGSDPLAFLSVSRSAPALSYAEADGMLVSFAANAPRISAKGLLIEGQRTNLLLRSQDFSAVWTTTAATATPAAGAAPDGAATATMLAAAATNNLHLVQQIGIAVTSGPHTVSIYVKPAGYSAFGIREAAVTGSWATFDLRGSGSVIRTSGVTGAVHLMAGGWYRVSMTYAATDSEHNYQFFLLNDAYVAGSPIAHAFVGDGASGALLWGAQVEQGGFASSYIPTVSAVVTRQADVIVLTGAAADAMAGGQATVLAVTPAQGHPTEGGARIVGSSGPVPLNTAGDMLVQAYNGSGYVTATSALNAAYPEDEMWSITAWSASETTVVGNGGFPAVAATGMSPITTAYLGSSNGGSALNGYISRLVIWDYERPASELVALSSQGQLFDPAAIIAWGDSLTSGNQDGSGVSWPKALGDLIDGPVYNNGGGGETSSQVLARFIAFASGKGSRSIIAIGRNNFDEAATVEGDIAAMVAALTTEDFLVLGILASATDDPSQSTGILALNGDLAATYGSKFVDMLSALQLEQDGSPEDAADVAAGHVPRSLRVAGDPLHLNAAGYMAMAEVVLAAMTTNGWD